MRVLLHVALAASLVMVGGAATAQEDRVETRAQKAVADAIAALNRYAEDPAAIKRTVMADAQYGATQGLR